MFNLGQKQRLNNLFNRQMEKMFSYKSNLTMVYTLGNLCLG